MNYHNILHDNMLNGEGLRVVLFLSGCTHNCLECHNPETHPLDSGIPFDDDAKQEIFEQLSKPYIKGITFTGGDPLHPENAKEVYELIHEIDEKFDDKDIWIYTGYKYEDLWGQQLKTANHADVLVDGKFLKLLADVNAPYVGSTNQRIIDIPATWASGKITKYEC